MTWPGEKKASGKEPTQQEHQGSPPTVSEPPRSHLLFDLEKWRSYVKSASAGPSGTRNEDEVLQMKKEKDLAKRRNARHKRTEWVTSSALPVSTFGRAPREDLTTARATKDYERRLYEGTNIDIEVRGGGAPVPTGKPVTIATAPRWSTKDYCSGSLENAPSSPDPQSYNPKPVRPTSARAVFSVSGRKGHIVLHKGSVLYSKDEGKRNTTTPRAGAQEEEEDAAQQRLTEAPRPPPGGIGMRNNGRSFGKAQRFQFEKSKKEGAAASLTGGPGPAAYAVDGERERKILSSQHRPTAASLSGPGRGVPAVVKANSLLYASRRALAECPGVGKYDVYSSCLSKHGASMAGPGRSTSPSKHRLKVEEQERLKRERAAEELTGADETDNRRSPKPPPQSSRADPNSIAVRSARSSFQRFSTADARRSFSVVKGQLVYRLHQGDELNDGPPGVGAYSVKDGTTVAERVTPRAPNRRPQSARASNRSNNRQPGDSDTQHPSTDHPSKGRKTRVEETISPGPGDYSAARRSDFDPKSFNVFLNPERRKGGATSRPTSARERGGGDLNQSTTSLEKGQR